jgi:hypothetical protein
MWVGGWRQMEQEHVKPQDMWMACWRSAEEYSASVSVKGWRLVLV